jgi:acetyl esterase/lipase
MCNFSFQGLGMPAVFLVLFGLLSVKVSAQSPRIIPLYPDSIPNSRPGPDQERSEVNPDGVLVISKVSRPTLTIYSPDSGKANGTAVVICPGGGYWVEAVDLEGTDFAKRFAKEGVLGIVLKYRLPADETMIDRSIGALQDAQQAIKIVREHAAEWRIDPRRIGIMGFSAGGHLAAMAATHFGKILVPDASHVSVRPDFMILGYPVITCTDSSRHAGSCEQLIGKYPTRERMREFSNELQVTDATPPAFLVHASDDTGVPAENSILFYQALLQHHVPAELHLYEHSGHGFGMHLKNTPEDWMERCFHWMEANGWMAVQRL